MIKKYLPTAALLTGGLLLFRYLRGKTEAGKNLKYEPVGVYIDAARSAETNFYRLYYIVKIRLVNDYQQSVNINALNLEATSNGRPLGTLTSNIAFIVPSMGSKTVELSASVATTGILSTVIDAIQNGFNIPVKISGYINTDLGRLNINFTKQVGTQSISAPYEYKVTDCLDSRDCQIAMDEIFSNNPGAKNDFSKLTQKEKTRYFRLKRRQVKFIQQGK